MFERYTEKARRTIFFARYEASQFGTPSIEAEYLLLALFREDKPLMQRVLPDQRAADQIRHEVERHTVQGQRISTAVDLPLSDECKRVLAYATEESERLHHQHIGNEHLLLGLLREKQSLAAKLLAAHGVTAASIREDLQPQRPIPPLAGIGSGSGARRLPFSYPLATVKVSDVSRSIAFYGALGFTVTQQLHSGQIALLNSGPIQLALVDESIPAGLLCFMVVDLAATSLRLQDTGCILNEPVITNANGAETLLVRDPDGQLILLVSGPVM